MGQVLFDLIMSQEHVYKRGLKLELQLYVKENPKHLSLRRYFFCNDMTF